MAYKFEFDDRRLGDREFGKESYRLIHDGLNGLLEEVKIWNKRAQDHGAAPPYVHDAEFLERMIGFSSNQLRERSSHVRVSGMSVGSMRYLRAGMELALVRKRNQLQKKRTEGWPSAVLESLAKSIEEIEKVASRLDVPPADLLWEVLPAHESAAIALQIQSNVEETLWDAFISHASDDKDAFVRPLAEALSEVGLKIWYDESSLQVGDSLRRSIDKGLSRARYGIVVLSPSFFAKEWPQKELDGLIARETGDHKVILPVWHNLNVTIVRQYSPTLADRVATQSKDGLKQVLQDLLPILKPRK